MDPSEVRIQQEIARLEVETMEHTRQWLAANPGFDVDQMYTMLEEWHAEHIVEAIMYAASVHGPIWAGEQVAQAMATLADEAESMQSSAQLSRRAATMAGDLVT